MKQISEDILTRALKLRDEGLSLERILAAFSAEEASDLKQYFDLIANLRIEAEKIAPPSREVLRGALRHAAAAQTATARTARFSKNFGYMPFGLRLLAPVLVVLFLVVFADRSRVIAPGQEASNRAVSEDGEIQTKSAAPDVPVDGAGTEALAPMSAPAPMAAKSFASPEATPSAVADQIVQAYLTDDIGSADFKSLEELLAEAPENQKRAIADFKAALDKAYGNKGESLEDFEAEVNAAAKAFKDALGQ